MAVELTIPSSRVVSIPHVCTRFERLVGFKRACDTRYSTGILLRISWRRLAATSFQSGDLFAFASVITELSAVLGSSGILRYLQCNSGGGVEGPCDNL